MQQLLQLECKQSFIVDKSEARLNELKSKFGDSIIPLSDEIN